MKKKTKTSLQVKLDSIYTNVLRSIRPRDPERADNFQAALHYLMTTERMLVRNPLTGTYTNRFPVWEMDDSVSVRDPGRSFKPPRSDCERGKWYVLCLAQFTWQSFISKRSYKEDTLICGSIVDIDVAFSLLYTMVKDSSVDDYCYGFSEAVRAHIRLSKLSDRDKRYLYSSLTVWEHAFYDLIDTISGWEYHATTLDRRGSCRHPEYQIMLRGADAI